MPPVIRIESGSMRVESGAISVIAPEVVVALPGTPQIHWDFTDISTLFQNTDNSNVVTASGQNVNSVDDKGSLGITLATDHVGTPNPPEFQTNVLNGLSGITFDGGNTEGLVSDSVDFSKAVAVMLIGVRPASVNVTGRALTGPNNATFMRFTVGTVSHQVETLDSKSSQSDGSPAVGGFAAWAITSASTGECSMASAPGSDLKTGVAPSEPGGARAGVGTDDFAATLFADCSVVEIAFWDNASATIPNASQMEAYVTARYGLSWA